MALSNITAEAVRKAIAEFDVLGRDAFLKKYEFGKARDYFVVGDDGQRYDSKAIVGAAHGYLGEQEEPLGRKSFSGGDATVAKLLERLGFVVERRESVRLSPIVLVENERTAGGQYDHWQDATGERYQFPNSYKNKVRPGRRFVYYRGTRRADDSRAMPDYFGHGIIGEIYIDPKTEQSAPKGQWKWCCDIEVYEPFTEPVPFKHEGDYIERIAQNQWSVGVREITELQYEQILTLARAPALGVKATSNADTVAPIVARAGSLLAEVAKPDGKPCVGGGSPRRSRDSKAVGDKGEEAVLLFLREQLPADEADTLRWVAQDGERPGYDISYESDGQMVGVEVKSTRGSAFPSIEITANEWRAASQLGSNYRVALVAMAMSSKPIIEFVDDPARQIADGTLAIETSVHRLTRLSD